MEKNACLAVVVSHAFWRKREGKKKMYINYGDRNFFENGILVDDEHEENGIRMLRCLPYSDEEDKFQFARLFVDVTDQWINKKAVCDFAGLPETGYDPVDFAIACTDFYPWENFGAGDFGISYNWMDVNKAALCKELKGYLIASDNLDIEW